MNILDIINKKKNNIDLTEEEINFFVTEYTISKKITDYQASSLLMAININGMSYDESYYLTKSFVNNSKTYSFDKKNILIDKHSSGGIGDKVTIILTPILLALGYDIAKISGRGLGYTGGTIDKLESIGVNFNYNFTKANNLFKKVRAVLLEQSDDLVPSDKMIYALRDTTSNIDSFPLIASSILSKKFIINSDYIFLDLKVGSGALFKNYKQSKKFSKLLLNIATKFNRKLFIELTFMDQPLGRCIGNKIEIRESIEFLKGKFRDKKLEELIKNFLLDIIITIDNNILKSEAIKKIDDILKTKKPYLEFERWVTSCGSTLSKIKNSCDFKSKYSAPVYATEDGYIKYKSASEIGLIGLQLGTGRIKKDDKIDYEAGIWLKQGPEIKVKKGDNIAILYSSKSIDKSLIFRFNNNIVYNKKNNNKKMILKSLHN